MKVRTSIITGDIPLLLSKSVLGKLGMVFDVENMKADFHKVGLTQYELLSTASGHPAIPIIPARASAGTTPALEIEDLELAPRESYMSVFAVAYQGPSKPDLTGIFQPKKLDPTVRNLLSEDRLAQDPYLVWWKQTSVDRDFWLETPNAWIRVHVVPRRALFNPSNRRTSASMQQDMLIAMIGKTRMTESVCCATGRWNEHVLDHWKPGQFEQPTFPHLWIGRTVFYKTAPNHNSLEAPRDNELNAMPSDRPEQDEQDRAPRRSGESGTCGSQVVVQRRAQGDPPRVQGGPQGRGRQSGDERTCSPNHAGVESEGGLHGSAVSDGGNQRKPPSPDQGQREHPGERVGDVRQVPWLRVSGSTSFLRGVGSGGSQQERQREPGPDSVCQVVPQGEDDEEDPDLQLRGPRGPSTLSGRRLEHQERVPQSYDRVDNDDADYTPRAQPQGATTELISGILGSSVEHPSPKWQREPEGDCDEDHGERGGPRRAGGDPDLADPTAQGQGQEQWAVSEERGPGDVPQHRDKSYEGKCCAEIYQQSLIPETDFDEAYADVKEIFANSHHEHYEPNPQEGRHDKRDQGECERQARKAYQDGDFNYETCRKLLESADLPTRPTRTMCNNTDDNTPQAYVTYGMFTHGGVRGLTTATKEHCNLGFAKFHLQGEGTWSSISVTKNVSSGLHRDSHNARGSNNHWKGDRWGLVFHTVRKQEEGGEQVKKFLKNCGFPLPRRNPAPILKEKSNKLPRKAKRNEIANMAGKLSALFTTLLVASRSFLAEASGPIPPADPIVMMEIGGHEGTIEAVELDKAVVEPMEWDDLLNLEAQQTAHHFVTGATPKELRLHLDNVPNRCLDFVIDLARAQLDEGGEVVLRGRELKAVVNKFTEYVSYHDHNGDDGWIVLRKSQKGQRLLPGHQGGRPHEVHAAQAEDRHEQRPRKLDGSGITFGDGVAGDVQSALRRLHQNLGHPRQEDLLRHLRLAGCEPHILKAVKSMRCETCQSTKRPMLARPSTLPRLLDFNSCVGIDLFYVHDINDKRHTLLSMVDWATTYHVVTKLDSETSEDVEKALNSSWINPFGAPYMVSLDLDPKIQSGMSRLCDWHNIKVKDAAAQAHWQAGVTERQGGWFKGIWDRVVQDLSLEDSEVEIAGTLVCAAKNELRRRCGHSPTQWVFGKLPRLPPELGDPDAGEEVSWDVTKDAKFQRTAAIRASARIAFHRAQGDERLRRALLQRARTQQRDYEAGDPVHYWEQPKDRRRGRWVGPAVVVGRQGANYWVSRAGKCRLTAAEHLRASGPEEVGEFLTMKGMQREVEKLLAEDLDEPGVFEDGYESQRLAPGQGEDEHLSDYELSEPDAPIELDIEEEVQDREDHDMVPDEPPGHLPLRRLKKKTRPGPYDDKPEEAMMIRRDLTQRGHAKRQEKELMWKEIPEEARPLFKEAEKKQWLEHLEYDALQALSVEESRLIRATVTNDRILRSRWAYKDKNWAARQSGKQPEWRCKSRLIIGRRPRFGIQ